MSGNEGQKVLLSPGSVFKAALVLIFLYVLFLLKSIVLVVLTAVVIASALEPGTRWLEKRRIPRLPAVVIIYLALAIFLFGVFYFAIPPLLQDMSEFLKAAPAFLEGTNFLSSFSIFDNVDISQSQAIVSDIQQTISLGDVVTDLSDYVTQIPGGVFSLVSAVFGGVVSFGLIVVISFYLSVQRNGIDNFLRIIIPFKHQEYAIDLWRRGQAKIGLWMQGQLLLMLIVAVLVYLGLTILGVKHALLFALLAGVFELIPLFGPILASIPAIAIAFTSSGLTLALVVAGLYIIIQQFENHLIYPLVVHKVVGVPVLLVILALLVGGQLAGFLGVILAVPLATVLMEFTNDIEKRNRARMQKSQ